MHECLKSVSFFLSASRAVCYRMIEWKKGLELALNEKTLKSLEFLRTSSTGTLLCVICRTTCNCQSRVKLKLRTRYSLT